MMNCEYTTPVSDAVLPLVRSGDVRHRVDVVNDILQRHGEPPAGRQATWIVTRMRAEGKVTSRTLRNSQRYRPDTSVRPPFGSSSCTVGRTSQSEPFSFAALVPGAHLQEYPLSALSVPTNTPLVWVGLSANSGPLRHAPQG